MRLLRAGIASLGLLAAAGLVGVADVSVPTGRHPVGHPREGLPTSDAPVPTYARDPGHWLNELHALLFTQTQAPAEVGGALPSERTTPDDAFFVKGWQFKKRKGAAADKGAFGGDVRVSAVIEIEPARRARLMTLLDKLATPEKVVAVPELREPLAKLFLQWDVLSLWWRLETDKNWSSDDAELLAAMAKAIRALALPKATLEALPDGLDAILKQYAGKTTPKSPAEPYLPPAMLATPLQDGWVEVDRKAGKLFRGDVALRSSRILLNAGDKEKSVALVESVGKVKKPDVPPLAQVGLIMTLVGYDDTLSPVATPVVDEVRVRRLTGPFKTSGDNRTSSHDGVDHWIYYRSRPGTLLSGTEPFRFIPDTTQGLFLEYGSAKHTTFAGQCALCHRADMNTPTLPLGVSVLNNASKPRVTTHPLARRRAAEAEMPPVTAKLKARLGG